MLWHWDIITEDINHLSVGWVTGREGDVRVHPQHSTHGGPGLQSRKPGYRQCKAGEWCDRQWFTQPQTPPDRQWFTQPQTSPDRQWFTQPQTPPDRQWFTQPQTPSDRQWFTQPQWYKHQAGSGSHSHRHHQTGSGSHSHNGTNTRQWLPGMLLYCVAQALPSVGWE